MDAGSVSTTIAKGALEATVSSHGAQLTSLKLQGVEYLWQGDGRWWGGQAPVLFPIVGSLRDNWAMSAQGPAPMARHGVARLCDFALVSAVEDAVSLTLAANDETRALYPYDFELTLTYALTDEGSLAQTFTVRNPGEVTLPFALGGHPAFNVPVSPAAGETFEDWRLTFARPWSATTPVLTANGLWDFSHTFELTHDSATLPLTHRLFQTDTLCLTHVPGSIITLEGAKSQMGVTVSFEGFDYLGIWSASHQAPFVAIEPWTGCATAIDEEDVLEAKRGMTLLEPGDVFERTFTVHPF